MNYICYTIQYRYGTHNRHAYSKIPSHSYDSQKNKNNTNIYLITQNLYKILKLLSSTNTQYLSGRYRDRSYLGHRAKILWSIMGQSYIILYTV